MLRKMAVSSVCSSQLEQLRAIDDYVKQLFRKDPTGHDYYHMKRVSRLAKKIAEKEGADLFICEAGALLHDVGDRKLFDSPELAKKHMFQFLRSIHFSEERILKLYEAIKDTSFSKGQVPSSLEGKVIQDADRIDAIGAIGIARTFAFGGAKGQLIYDEENPEKTSIQHFYDKLLLLKDQLNTEFAKVIAEERHLFLEQFLKRFHSEMGP